MLDRLLTFYGMSEAELSRKIDMPRATINRLVSGRTPDPRASTLKLIANHFNVSVDQLLGKQPLFSKTNQTILATANKSLPIIAWNEARDWKKTIDSIAEENYFLWVVMDSKDTGAFAVKVVGDAMWPQFQENTILIIDPLQPCKNRDFVISYIKKNDEIVFRQLITEGKYKLLKAVNPIFPIIEIDDCDEIIGTIIQTRNFYK